MTEPRLRIAIVDDDPVARQSLAFFIDQSRYDLDTFDSGESLLSAVGPRPDIILLDVEMPGMDGIEACRGLRQRGGHYSMVIFVSAHDDLETRLTAYDAGGSDYIVKPYTEAELIRKIRVAEQILQQHQDVIQQAGTARKMAFSAMSTLGETGTVLAFMRNSFACRTPQALALALSAAVAEFGLGVLVKMRVEDGDYYFARGSESCTPLEQSILEYAAGKGRLAQSRDYLVVNYPRITMVATGLTQEESDRAGRLRDHLAVLGEAAGTCLAAQENERQRLAQATVAVSAAAELSQAVEELEGMYEQHRLAAIAVGDNYLEELDAAFLHLGLSETQEVALIEMARRAVEHTAGLLEVDQALQARLQEIVCQLRNITTPVAAGH